jgi:ABC-2 type transport system ATP-binding protein
MVTMSAQGDFVLEVQDVQQSFRVGFWMKRATVLHGVSLRVPRRSIFGFLGANGAGKTTLINLIVGLRKPSAGTVKVAGFDAVTSEARARIGYLPERPYFHEHLTGAGVLRYFGALAGMTPAQIQERIPKVLADVGMSAAREVELKRYSKGMLQRIGIAQALLHNPEFLILDEPMSGLDPMGRKEMRELIVKLAAEGRTVFFSSHVIPDVEAICDQVALIQRGKLLGCGPINQFLSQGPVQTEVAFDGIPFDQARSTLKEFSSLRQMPGGLKAIAPDPGSVRSALKKIIDLNGQILWVNPIRPSLESLFGTEADVDNAARGAGAPPSASLQGGPS